MRIGVDFDDVLYPYHHYLKRRLERRFGIDLHERRVTTFYYDLLPDFARRGITREDVWEEVQATWREVESHDEAKLLDPEAAPILARLRRRHRVTVVTARSQDALPYVSRFLRRHRIRPHEILLGHEEKSGFDVLIDDFPRHAVENCASGGYALLYTIDENSTFDESRHPRILRVASWREVEDALGEISRRKRAAPRESPAARRERTQEIIRRLRGEYPDIKISLEYTNDFQLLVAVMLSAQCTDAMVNRVTKSLFRKYRSAKDFSRADRGTLEQEIRPTGYFRSKAKNVIGAAKAVEGRFGGQVPSTMEDLVSLPGVGRKTANVVLWNAFSKQEGIAVDTHVTRLSRLLRLTHRKDPVGIERDLQELVPQKEWGDLTHLLISHGRAVCVARRPRCEVCVLNPLCPSAARPLEKPPSERGPLSS